MRKVIKTVLVGPEKFIPKIHAEDASLSEDNKDIKDRPMVFMVKKMTREDRLNLQSLIETEAREINGKTQLVPLNFGTIARYLWENCVLEVRNVLTKEGEFESVIGQEKDQLFNTEGIDVEIVDCLDHIQKISSLSEEESKN